jgi:hypothetical protein
MHYTKATIYLCYWVLLSTYTQVCMDAHGSSVRELKCRVVWNIFSAPAATSYAAYGPIRCESQLPNLAVSTLRWQLSQSLLLSWAPHTLPTLIPYLRCFDTASRSET